VRERGREEKGGCKVGSKSLSGTTAFIGEPAIFFSEKTITFPIRTCTSETRRHGVGRGGGERCVGLWEISNQDLSSTGASRRELPMRGALIGDPVEITLPPPSLSSFLRRTRLARPTWTGTGTRVFPFPGDSHSSPSVHRKSTTRDIRARILALFDASRISQIDRSNARGNTRVIRCTSYNGWDALYVTRSDRLPDEQCRTECGIHRERASIPT